MVQLNLKGILLNLSKESNGVRVTSEAENTILLGQTIENVANCFVDNFEIISSYYELKISTQLKMVYNLSDIYQLAISILLYYLYMYNSWQLKYKRHDKYNFKFKFDDFDKPSTHDIIFNYFKKRYSEEWKEKSSVLLGIDMKQLQVYYKKREEYYNM